MGIENFKNFGRKAVLVGAGIAGALSSEGVAQADPVKVFQAKKTKITVKYDYEIKKAKTPAKKEELIYKREAELAKLELENAQAEDANEKAKPIDSNPKDKKENKDIDSFRHDKRDLREKYSEEIIEEPIYNSKGEVVGHRKVVKKDGTKGTVRKQNNVTYGPDGVMIVNTPNGPLYSPGRFNGPALDRNGTERPLGGGGYPQ